MTAVGAIKLGPKVSVEHLTWACAKETHRAANRAAIETFIESLVLFSFSFSLDWSRSIYLIPIRPSGFGGSYFFFAYQLFDVKSLWEEFYG